MSVEIHDNLEEMLKEVENESPIQRERRAELTLLCLLEDMPQEERIPFLQEAGVSSDDFFRIYSKWEHVLIKYRETKEKQNAGK
jgi:hypothetical protein